MNINENEMANIKNLVDNGNISEAISHISPEMIQNFSKILSQNNNQTEKNTEVNNNNNNNSGENNHNQNTNSNFDLNGIDINTIMKMSSAIGKMNNSKDDPRANLLNSLRPYLRENKKGKLDNYMNLLNVTKIAEIIKDNNKETP